MRSVIPPSARTDFELDGFVILPSYLSGDELAPALAVLPREFPTADEYHDNVDPARNERFRDEFAGITDFPFASVELSLLAVHHRLMDLAEDLLSVTRLRVYSIEAWAKYTGAADYDQPHHRDYLNHTVVVPAPGQPPCQVEMFVYLCDVPATLGPPTYVPLRYTAGAPALPNWYPREDGTVDPERPTWRSTAAWHELYDAEVNAVGPAGTVVAYRNETFHRGTALTSPRGVRYTIHVSFRRAECAWIGRMAWPRSSTLPGWDAFVARATPRQLQLFGFPPPGHPYWTADTLAGCAARYPGFDLDAWRNG
jgi:hypothetical protein